MTTVTLNNIKHRFEYSEYPSKWENKLKDLKNAENIVIDVDIMNIMYLDEIFDYCEQNNLPTPTLNRADHNVGQGDEEFGLNIFPKHMKEQIESVNKKSKHQEIRESADWLSYRHNDRLPDFQSFIRKFDDDKGTSFDAAFPEFADAVFGGARNPENKPYKFSK